MQILRGPATVTDESVSDTTESTACAEAFGKVKAAFGFPAERELRGKQVQILRGPATVTDESVSDTTESTACAEAFGKVKAAFEFPARRPA